MKNYKLSVKYDNSGRVYFTVTYTDLMNGDYPREYHTDVNGKGLFFVLGHESKQIRGTCQFSTTGNRSTDRQKFIRELMLNE